MFYARPGYSTEMAPIVVIGEFQQVRSGDSASILPLLHHSEAFNTTDPEPIMPIPGWAGLAHGGSHFNHLPFGLLQRTARRGALEEHSEAISS